MTVFSNLKKRKEMIKILQFQYMTMKVEIGELKERKLKSDLVRQKKEYEYLTMLTGVSELKESFGFTLGNQVYEENFIAVNKKYYAYLESKNVSSELQELLNKKLDEIVIHKRKVDHLNNVIKKEELNILFENI